MIGRLLMILMRSKRTIKLGHIHARYQQLLNHQNARQRRTHNTHELRLRDPPTGKLLQNSIYINVCHYLKGSKLRSKGRSIQLRAQNSRFLSQTRRIKKQKDFFQIFLGPPASKFDLAYSFHVRCRFKRRLGKAY